MTHDLEEACRDVDVAVLLSGVPLRPGCSAQENVARSAQLYRQLGTALEAQASRDVKVPLDSHLLVCSIVKGWCTLQESCQACMSEHIMPCEQTAISICVRCGW